MSARISLITVLMLGALARVDGQSLGQVADQEAKRRQRVASGKQYTNDNLRPESRPAEAPLPATAAAPAAESHQSQAPAAATSPDAGTATTEKPLVKEHRDEAYWRGRTRELRGHMQRLQTEVDAVTARLNDLGGSAGAEREREVSQGTLDRLGRDLQSFTKELQRFQDRARRANVPAEWVN